MLHDAILGQSHGIADDLLCKLLVVALSVSEVHDLSHPESPHHQRNVRYH